MNKHDSMATDYKVEKPEPWKTNVNSVLVLYSILAAVDGVFIAIVFQAPTNSSLSNNWIWSIPFLVISLILFIFSAEALTDALDEDDVRKYLATLVVYNFAVICLIVGLMFAIYFQYHSWFCNKFTCRSNRLIFVAIVQLLLPLRWIIHLLWLLFKRKSVLEEYIREMKGEQMAIKDRSWYGWSNLYLRIKNMNK